jgi:hypothetical protein
MVVSILAAASPRCAIRGADSLTRFAPARRSFLALPLFHALAQQIHDVDDLAFASGRRRLAGGFDHFRLSGFDFPVDKLE